MILSSFKRKIDRAERRRMEKSAKQFDERKFFTKDELERMNKAAYDLALEHIIRALKSAFRFGPKRIQRLTEELWKIQQEDFGYYIERGKRIYGGMDSSSNS